MCIWTLLALSIHLCGLLNSEDTPFLDAVSHLSNANDGLLTSGLDNPFTGSIPTVGDSTAQAGRDRHDPRQAFHLEGGQQYSSQPTDVIDAGSLAVGTTSRRGRPGPLDSEITGGSAPKTNLPMIPEPDITGLYGP